VTDAAPRLVLASASPRRHALLRELGLGFSTRVPDVDEQMRPGEGPEALTLRLALAKVGAVPGGIADGEVVLAADTVVCLDDRILGKPVDAADAASMLQALSGRAHTVCTAVAVANRSRQASVVSATRVWMRAIDTAEIEAYIASGEPMDKAGAYAIQGRGCAFVSRIDGSHTGVVGLPLFETLALLADFGIRP